MPRKKIIQTEPDVIMDRLSNLYNWNSGRSHAKTACVAVPKGYIRPKVKSSNNSRDFIDPRWISVTAQTPSLNRGNLKMHDINANTLPRIEKSFKNKLEAETDFYNAYFGWVGIIMPEYEMLEPYTILDTESYLQQAIRRKHSLMFRNGYNISGDNDTFREYIERRFDQIGFMMEQTMESFFKDVLFNLLVCSNCVVVKIRDEEASGGKKQTANGKKIPVAAYRIVPINTIYPYLDGKGKIEKWRRFFADGRSYKDYPVNDVIHFHWDKKAGHVFGTPRVVPVKDDIMALRRIEENIELLLIHHLFPFFHVKVGTEKAPATFFPDGPSEIDFVRSQIEDMPKEGMFVTDERVAVDVIGAKSEALDYKDIVKHYKDRIFTGMGMSPIDMAESDTGTRAGAEAVSQNLKDTIKAELGWFCSQVKMFIIKELFQEAPFKLSVQNAVADVNMVFPEIDLDNLIKIENHILNKFNNHLMTEDEARRALKSKILTDAERKNTHFYLHVLKLAVEVAKVKATMAGSPEIKATPKRKVTSTKSQPTNQHGKNTDPHKARSSLAEGFLKLVKDGVLDKLDECTLSDGELDIVSWQEVVDAVFEAAKTSLEAKELQKSYTNQDRVEVIQTMDDIRVRLSEESNPDMISVILEDAHREIRGDNDVETK